MTQREMEDVIRQTFNECLEISRSKNADYAGESAEDPFANFNASEVVQVPVVRGMMVRLMDKIVRISNLLDQDNHVKDEPITDSIHDGINYLALIKAKLIADGRMDFVAEEDL